MNNWMLFVVILIIFIIGLARSIYDYLQALRKNNYSVEFINIFREFATILIQQEHFESEKYQWLMMNASKMQNMMGSYGIASYKPPFANYMFKNYQLIVNGIREIKDTFQRAASSYGLSFEKRWVIESINIVDDALITFVGAMGNYKDEVNKQLKNPLIWLREGVRFVVTSPISLFYWSGLMKYRTYNIISNNFFVKFLSFLIGIVGVVSSIVTIVTGYTPFKSIIGF
ncbi:hypothetical protein [Paenibacillus sp. B01]|uniref:hypothetical protein n=1 Tax=Paenibacillus sp. B01 TaxID=2660554 RepID=UPI00129B6785|nr:hypothetical protein [Paenibacillus sp. B01]QGG57901.1 hypothetical protein GE073_21570 [Paenibacillus sp. B01]